MQIWRRPIVKMMRWIGLLLLVSVEWWTAEGRARLLARVEIEIKIEVLEEAEEVCGL